MREHERHVIDGMRTELHEVRRGVDKLKALIKEGFETMASRAAEMNAALDKLATIVTEGMAEIEKQMTVIADPGTSEADMDAAITRVNGIVSTVQAGVDRLKSDNPPEPTP